MNLFSLFSKKYAGHDEAIIISSFFNPMNSPYRIKAFNRWYDTIKHLNHKIVECVIGNDKPQLPKNPNIEVIHAENLLWHKESILNGIVEKLPKKYKYIFWIDADVIFTNKNWLPEAVSKLFVSNILQPFEYCVHLAQDEKKPSFKIDRDSISNPLNKQKTAWKSFCSNWVNERNFAMSENYDQHGHVGFAWGARRSLLDKIPLYDKALIGGADHIIAHAAVGQIPHPCIVKAFKDDLDNVLAWSKKFYRETGGHVEYVPGDLYHIWHGDIDKRQYLKRIQDFTVQTKTITKKDKNGLYVTNNKQDDVYVRNYFRNREVTQDDGFLTSMAIGYMTDSTLMGTLGGGNFVGAMFGASLKDSQEKKTHIGVDYAAPNTKSQTVNQINIPHSSNFS